MKYLLIALVVLTSCAKQPNPTQNTQTSNSITVSYIVKYGTNDSISYQLGKCFTINKFSYSITLPSNTGHYFEVHGNETGGNADSIQMQVVVNGNQVFNQKALGYISYYISE